MYVQALEDLEVGLDPRASGGVGSGDAERYVHDRAMVRSAPVLRIPILWAVAALLAGLAAGPSRGAEPPTVILVSLDGTRPEDLRGEGLEVFATLASRGAVARLTPVFPTNTFPNHVSLVTGVSPAVHGIVNNTFEDPLRGRFSKGNDPTWIEVEPIWALLDGERIVSASFHWVGSEGPWRNGRGPRHWKAFSPRIPVSEKVDQILSWLELPRETRPRLVTTWFPGADGAAHRHGPGGEPTARALRGQAASLARLLRALDDRHAFSHTTLIVVSDHGMAPVERSLDLGAALSRGGVRARVLGGGGFVTAWVEGDPGRAIEIARGLGLEAFAPGDAPTELGLSHVRFGDLVALAPPGTAIASRSSSLPPMRGGHGYRAELPSMGGIFLAVGRGFDAGARLTEVRALDVAPTVLALLGAPIPEWMEGRPLVPLPAGGTVNGP